MAKQKKFTDAAESFFTGAKEEQEVKQETKRATKRFNLVLDAEDHERLVKIAYMKRATVTGIIKAILQEYIDEHRDIIEAYDKGEGRY